MDSKGSHPVGTEKRSDSARRRRVADMALLRVLALGSRTSEQIERIVSAPGVEDAGRSALASLIGGLAVPDAEARGLIDRLQVHRARMEAALGRPVRIKTAAMDYLESEEGEDKPAGGKAEDELTYDLLLRMAFRDHLTGLANYRHFARRFEEEVRRSGRFQRYLSILIIDIDHFKRFNDRHGHEVGNRALVHLGKLLAAGVGDTDLVARYGGEEFAVILPETFKHRAAQIGEQIRSCVESAPFALDGGGEETVTVSLGLATYPRDEKDHGALLSCADRALYASKSAGRNRLTAYEPESSITLSYRPDNPQAANSVHVVGVFNGWDRMADPMRRGQDGGFSLTLRLAPGRYAYKFVVNSEYYISDPAATESVPDGFGGRNSVFLVK